MNRSFTAKLLRRTPRRLRDYLWATHRIFNDSLAYLLKHYFWMQNLTDRAAQKDNRNRLRTRFNSEQLEWLKLIYRDMMGLDLPKEKRAGRSQSAQAWMEPITFSRGSKGEGPGASSKNIHQDVKQAIRALRKSNSWLFDRELALPVSPDNGFRRGLFGSAARRILNFEQNEDTHQGYLEAAKRAFERWAGGQQGDDSDKDEVDTRRVGWKRTVLLRDWRKHENAKREAEVGEIGCLTWADFEQARAEFVAYEIERSKNRAEEHRQTFDSSMTERINGAMTRGWRDIYERLMPPDADGPPDANQAVTIVKAYQTAEPRRIGDINFFLWLASKPHLWRFVETMRRFDDFQRKLEQYARPIQFRYPRYNRRPEWFTFSETSPGHMYTIVSMNPMVIELCVFVPTEDAPVLARLAKGKPLNDVEEGFLEQPIDWTTLRLTLDRLTQRRADYVDELKKRDSRPLDSANLQAVHDWTDHVWRQLLGGFFRDEPPLDSSRFKRMMVRYELATDGRLGHFVDAPKDDKELIGRLVVETNDRQKSHWQGAYKYWFGPLADRNGSLAERRRFLRALPLLVGGIRLEYRGPLRNAPNPIFTLSCELDERITDGSGKRAFPAPSHRIPKKESNESPAPKGEEKVRRRASTRPRKLPVGLRILAIDLGQRHVATGAVVEFVDNGNGLGVLPTPFKPLAVEFIDVPGVTLTHIQRHQDERRRKQRKACPRGSRKAFEVRGTHLPRGQLFARDLLDHFENLKDDRCKKSAHAVLRASLKHGVDYIVFENLKGYRPDMEFGRRTNTSLMNWNRRELVEFVRMEATPLGIGVYEWVPPHHTSRFCHRCGGVGCRFTHVTDLDAAKDTLAPAEPAVDAEGEPLLDTKGKRVFRRKWTPNARRVRGTPLGLIAAMRQAIDGGKHFCCCECGLMANADYNAAMNLARKLASDFPAYQRYTYNAEQKLWVVDGQTLVGTAFWDRAKALVQTKLNGHFGQPSRTPPAGGWPAAFPIEAQDSPF